MNFTCITLHNENLNLVIDAAIPNKAQNHAVKAQVAREIDALMNRIASGWLEDKVGTRVADHQINHMADRFLVWRLPKDFNPDGGISFKKAINESRPDWPQENEPTGTNLLDATQARQMVRFMVEEMPGHDSPPTV